MLKVPLKNDMIRVFRNSLLCFAVFAKSYHATWFARDALLYVQLAASASAKTINIEAGDDFEASCLFVVEPGDTCYLAKGDYKHDGLTRVHGTEDNRITITGDSGACIKGSNTQDRALQIAHDYYTIEGICFDGEHGNDYVATAIYVLGADKKSTKNGVTSSVTGLQMFDLEIRNFYSECVHFRCVSDVDASVSLAVVRVSCVTP